jgi:riboflavin biosynthesis pyrimidine reductase
MRTRSKVGGAGGIEVIFAGRENEVEGGALTAALGRLGFFSLYLLAGPRMLETMLRDRALSRLYVTVTHRLLGGQPFHSMIDGPLIGVAGRLKLRCTTTLLQPNARGNGSRSSNRNTKRAGRELSNEFYAA